MKPKQTKPKGNKPVWVATYMGGECVGAALTKDKLVDQLDREKWSMEHIKIQPATLRPEDEVTDTDTDDRVERVALAIGDAIWGTSARNDTPENWDRALTYARAAIAAADEWRPIETAPKDGTHILLGRKGEPVCEGFYDDWSDGQWACDFTPTHWRPMPKAPEAK